MTKSIKVSKETYEMLSKLSVMSGRSIDQVVKGILGCVIKLAMEEANKEKEGTEDESEQA